MLFKIIERHEDGGRFGYDDVYRTVEEAETAAKEYKDDDDGERESVKYIIINEDGETVKEL